MMPGSKERAPRLGSGPVTRPGFPPVSRMTGQVWLMDGQVERLRPYFDKAGGKPGGRYPCPLLAR